MFLLKNFSSLLIIGGALSLFIFDPFSLTNLELIGWTILLFAFIWQRHHISHQILITVSLSIIAILFVGCNIWNLTRQFIIFSFIAMGLIILSSIYLFDCAMRVPRKYL
ncbi:MAG: hypothetical protein ACRCST_15225 [Turicibacter sp.]